ncbi:hypothetical protein H257_13830 [Aphanomyces astaci]|uniref:RRM domain-containing protein n=1 Tax=Aphanomyces astaci TaxID=112090 RepID=W4FVA2_APHAT|nr:hypothetical protein H257_13830 [Aphanomyces astaci]ETV70739.1 hypothetical protein H257_13830 [Aphanomyces astaci]|eukprot:XP_009839803.1 hypothetical protein H257_13830 [Aphanomyces astaci]
MASLVVARNLLRRSFATNIYVEGIHWRTDAQRLQQAFEPFGPILKVSFAPTQTENIYLTGCVSYKKADDAFRAILAMNGQELDGRLLKVDYYDGTLDD